MVGLPVLQPLSPRQDCRIRFAAFVCKYSMIFRCSLNQQNLFILSQRKQKTFGQRKNTQPCLHASAGRKRSLNLTVSLAFLAFFPLAELPLELQLVGEERLSPAHILSQGPHVRGDVVTGGLNYRLPQFVREAQLWGGKPEVGHDTRGFRESQSLTQEITTQLLLPVRFWRKHYVCNTVPASGNVLFE